MVAKACVMLEANLTCAHANIYFMGSRGHHCKTKQCHEKHVEIMSNLITRVSVRVCRAPFAKKQPHSDDESVENNKQFDTDV